MCGIATKPSSLRRLMVNQSCPPGVLDVPLDFAVDDPRAVDVNAFPAVQGYKDALERDEAELLREIAEALAERKERDELRAVWRSEAAEKGLITCGFVAVICDQSGYGGISSIWGGDEALSDEHREALADNLSKMGMFTVSRLDGDVFENVFGGTYRSEFLPPHVIGIFPHGTSFPSKTTLIRPTGSLTCLAKGARLFSESGAVALVLAAGMVPTRVPREDGGLSAVSEAADAFMATIGGVGDGLCLLGHEDYHDPFVNAFAAYLPNVEWKHNNDPLVIVNPVHEKRSRATTTREATEMKQLEPSRLSLVQMRSLDDVVFTVESVKTPETQLVLIKKFETFLKDVTADPSTKFPLAGSRVDAHGARNEMKVVADFLKTGKRGNKKKKAEDMLDKLYTLRKLPRKYFIEKAAAEAAAAAASP